MGLFSFLTTLISIVYPVIASYKAFDNYLELSKSIDNSTIKVAGISIPLPLNFLLTTNSSITTTTTTTSGSTTTTTSSPDKSESHESLQNTLVTIQKWLIYWIVFGTVQFAESFLFFKWIVPFYSTLKLAFSIWLILPMVKSSFEKRQQALTTAKDFTITDDWIKFTQSGSGFIFFNYIQPVLGGQFDNIQKFADKGIMHYILENNPAIPIPSGSSSTNTNGQSTTSTTTSSFSPSSANQESFGAVLDNSYVMVMNIKNRFGYGNEDDAKSIVEEIDSVKSATTTETTGTLPSKKKGWIW
ncbi:hypothetical protein DFJ63DRAFT_318981 [Scheffersomyces coipomensis]|uniref:uncharacterized protein n=1 Tax=Scheffersomyces coipomensis TaxID=1788519 RepID=UPI00315D11FC